MITGMASHRHRRPRLRRLPHNLQGSPRFARPRRLRGKRSESWRKTRDVCPAGGSNIELMSPADPAAPLSQSLTRFLERRGEGLFALMLEAADPDAEAEELSGRGLNVLPLMAGAGGRDIHPNSTHGVLIRVYPNGSFQAPPPPENPNDAGLSGISRVIIAVHDLDRAADVYGRQLALPGRPAHARHPDGGCAARFADHLRAASSSWYRLPMRHNLLPRLSAASSTTIAKVCSR